MIDSNELAIEKLEELKEYIKYRRENYIFEEEEIAFYVRKAFDVVMKKIDVMIKIMQPEEIEIYHYIDAAADKKEKKKSSK